MTVTNLLKYFLVLINISINAPEHKVLLSKIVLDPSVLSQEHSQMCGKLQTINIIALIKNCFNHYQELLNYIEFCLPRKELVEIIVQVS